MKFIVDYQWPIFITLEVLSVVSLLLFGFLRYVLHKRRLSVVAIYGFLALLLTEALLAFAIYQKTKEIESFQIIVGIFVIYACTFGVFDFIKLDRWMRRKVGEWRGIELLTAKDYAVIKRQKDSKYVARKYRITSMIHLVVFMAGQTVLWYYGTDNMAQAFTYLKDLSWIETGNYEDSPYANETSYSIGMIWGIVFIVDFIYSWSYTVFPSKKK